MDYSNLKPGKRTIKVTVSDGVETVEDEFTATILDVVRDKYPCSE